MRQFIVLGILFASVCGLFAEEGVKIQAGNTGKKLKVLIVPLENKADKKKYANTSLFQRILFRSFYTFIGIMPTLDVPDERVLTNIMVNPKDVLKTANEYGADMIIYGNYKFNGDRYEPKAKTELRIWSMQSNKDVFSKIYDADTGVDIFDAIDEMIANAIKIGFNIEVNVATINFSDFKIGKEQYNLFVNDKLVETISNDGFSYSLKVLPDNEYRVVMRRMWDNYPTLQALVKLKEYQSFAVNYTALGKVKVSSIGFQDRNKKYSLTFDDEVVAENTEISNVAAGQNHTVKAFEGKTNLVYQETFYLRDGEYRVINPIVKETGFVHVKAFSLDRSMVSLGAEFFLWRYFWAGLGVGGSVLLPASTAKDSAMIFFVSPYAELGYYFLGDMKYDLRVGAGLSAKVDIYFPQEAVTALIKSTVPNFTPNIGAFVQIEWKFVVFKPAFYVYAPSLDDWSHLSFSYGLGIGLKI